jgi:hypothetical protein
MDRSPLFSARCELQAEGRRPAAREDPRRPARLCPPPVQPLLPAHRSSTTRLRTDPLGQLRLQAWALGFPARSCAERGGSTPARGEERVMVGIRLGERPRETGAGWVPVRAKRCKGISSGPTHFGHRIGPIWSIWLGPRTASPVLSGWVVGCTQRPDAIFFNFFHYLYNT